MADFYHINICLYALKYDDNVDTLLGKDPCSEEVLRWNIATFSSVLGLPNKLTRHDTSFSLARLMI